MFWAVCCLLVSFPLEHVALLHAKVVTASTYFYPSMADKYNQDNPFMVLLLSVVLYEGLVGINREVYGKPAYGRK